MINTIQLGNCYELIKNIPDKSIDLVYIDIPYEYENGGKGGTVSYITSKEYHTKIDKFSYGINYSILDELCRIMKNIYIYIWCSRDQILDLTKYFVEKKGCRVNYLVWCKTNPTPFTNDMWLPDLEYCLCFKDKNAPRYNDGIELKSKWYLSKKNRNDKEMFKHPTIKPLELVKRHILHSTQPNDIVLDCFCGSGTTCVAAKETGRRYIGMEIDPEYHKIAVNRLNGITAYGQTSIFTDFDSLESKGQ
jgi:DNA modification methylase